MMICKRIEILCSSYCESDVSFQKQNCKQEGHADSILHSLRTNAIFILMK